MLALALPWILAWPLAAQENAAAVPAEAEVLVAAASDWQYLADGSDPGPDWTAPWFDASAWPTGTGQLGYGNGDETTVLPFGPDSQRKPVVVRFRHSFDLKGAPGVRPLRLRLIRDDGAAVFLNGEELLRDNLPQGGLTANQAAVTAIWGIDEQEWHEYWFPGDLLRPGHNLLCVSVHQVGPASTDLSFDLELMSADPPPLLRGPYLQLGTPESVVVRWRTPLATPSVVRFGTDPERLSHQAEDPGAVTEHALQLSDLQPDTTYYYSISDGRRVLAGGDPQHFFRTPPLVGSRQPFRAWILGDPGTGNAVQAAVRDAYAGYSAGLPTHLWLLLGDNAYMSGTDREYQRAFYEVYQDMLRRSVVWSTRGNHEAIADVYYRMFTFPTAGEAGGVASGTEAYYSFDWGNVHFVCLDSTGTSLELDSPMLSWLAADLASTDQDFRVAFWHHPPYSKGSHDSDNPADSAGRLTKMRENVVPVLEAGGVDLTFTGHSHSYERSYLIGGHFGLSSTFSPEMLLDGGDGNPAGDGAYAVSSRPHDGAVYCVAGSSGQASGGSLDHPAMFRSLNRAGSVVLDVHGARLEVNFLASDGTVLDYFVLELAATPEPIHAADD